MPGTRPNVQGDRTMGIWESAPDSFLNKLEDVFQFKTSRNHGYDVVNSINAMHDGRLKLFFAMAVIFVCRARYSLYCRCLTQNKPYSARFYKN